MATNRTIAQSKDDLKAAADALTSFKKTFETEPTEIDHGDLPLFSNLAGVDDDDVELVDTLQTCYDVRYSFRVIIVLDYKCTEAEVVALRNSYITKLISLQAAAGTYPWDIESMRHYRGHWGATEGWFVPLRFSRYTVEDFS